jgi:hypothetical protein
MAVDAVSHKVNEALAALGEDTLMGMKLNE